LAAYPPGIFFHTNGAVVNTLFTLIECKGTLYSVKIEPSARDHGFTDPEIRHAWENAMKIVPYDYEGEDRLLAIGGTQSGQLLELVAVPVSAPTRIIHADVLRPKFYRYLER